MTTEPRTRHPQTVLITGATGFLGRRICAALHARGDRVIALARHPDNARNAPPGADRVLLWAPGMSGDWQSAFDTIDAVIHLAGESVGERRWNSGQKRRILESRVDGTRAVVDAIGAVRNPPRALVAASGIGYYGDGGDRELDESAPQGGDFLAGVCAAWEAEAQRAAESGTRVVSMRMGLVLSLDGGALPRMAFPYRLFAGGPLGSGRQWFPWIHIDDLIAAWLFALDTTELSGPVNVVAPGLVTNGEFSRALGKALHRPAFLRVPAFALRLVVGQFAETLLGGQRALPRRLQGMGFRFIHPDLFGSLADIFSKHAGSRQTT